MLRSKQRDAIEEALSGTSPEILSASVARLKDYTELLEGTRSTWTSDSLIAMIVALVVVLLMGLLWSRKVRETNISLNVSTDNIHAILERPWDLPAPIHARVIHVDHLSSLQDPGLGISIDDTDSTIRCWVEGDEIQLQNLHIDQDGVIDVAAVKDNLSLAASHTPFSGTILLIGKVTIHFNSAKHSEQTRTYDLSDPETIEYAQRSKTSASEIDIHSIPKWSFGVMPVKVLSFEYQQWSLADRQEQSGIHSGNLTFHDTSWPPTTLYASQYLSIKDASRAHFQLEGANSMMLAALSGPVQHLTLGDQNYQSELAPSYLEYLYGKRSLSLFWGAATAGWVLLWGIRKTLFR